MLKCKYQRIRGEWSKLLRKNAALAQVVWDLSVFVKDNFEKDVVITHLYRTKAQQEKFYGKGTKRKSPHQSWGAVDIRDYIYSKSEIAAMVDFLKFYDKWNDYRIIRASKSRTVLRHNIGHGMHFHIQFLNRQGHVPPRQIRFQDGLVIEASAATQAERD
jgi:hypothetical protein